MDNFLEILFGKNERDATANSGKEAKSCSAEVLRIILSNRARQRAELCYLVFVKPSEWKEWKEWIGERGYWAIVFSCMFIASAFLCGAAEENGYQPILHPSVFWHNNQWETYENGQWVPYRGSTHHEEAVEPEPEPVLQEPLPGPDMVDTNIYVPSYGWGFIGAPAVYAPYYYHHARGKARLEHQRRHKVVNGVQEPNAGLGQTTIGIGKPNVGIGQTTIGIGRPNAGIGQTTIGIGQPNMGIGRQNPGMGRTTIGVGQPNANVGQPTISVGQPNAGIGRTSVGVGQPISGQQPQQSRGR